MKNYVKPGKMVPYTNATGATIESGAPVVVGERVLIAAGKILNGEVGELCAEGVFTLAKNAPLVINQGDILYFDAADAEVKKDSEAGANKAIGYAHVAAASADTTCQVELRPIAVVTVEVPA